MVSLCKLVGLKGFSSISEGYISNSVGFLKYLIKGVLRGMNVCVRGRGFMTHWELKGEIFPEVL